jgi:hypothetical protein
MRDEIFHEMAAGMIGRFWPLIAGVPEQPGIHGAIRRDEEGYWVVDLEGWRSIGEGKGPNRG